MELTPIITDTDFISDFLVGKAKAESIFKELLLNNQVIISTSITVGELYYGKNRRKWQEKRSVALDNFLSLLTIISFGKEHTVEYGKIRANLVDKGTDIGFADCAIAAISRVENVPILTGNYEHFMRIDGITAKS